MIYLDYSANTPVGNRALQRFVEAEQRFIGNPNSHHTAGFEARDEMKRITELIAALLVAESSEIIHTSGASELRKKNSLTVLNSESLLLFLVRVNSPI